MQPVPNPLHEDIDPESLLDGPNRLDHLLGLLDHAHQLAARRAPQRRATRRTLKISRVTRRPNARQKPTAHRSGRLRQTRSESVPERSKSVSPVR